MDILMTARAWSYIDICREFERARRLMERQMQEATLRYGELTLSEQQGVNMTLDYLKMGRP
jgi:hypothetical protein